MPQPTSAQSGASARPLIVGIGDTLRDRSNRGRALRPTPDATAAEAEIQVFAGSDLSLPLYQPGVASARIIPTGTVP